MKNPNFSGLRIPALAILASLAFGKVSAQDAPAQKKQMHVKIITTVDGKTTITDTTLTTTGKPNEVRQLLGDKHPFYYKNLPECKRPPMAKTEATTDEMRKNIERKVWVRDSAMQKIRITESIDIRNPEEIREMLKTKELEIMRSPEVIRLQKDADGKVTEIKLNGKPMEVEKMLKERGIEPGTLHFRSAEPMDGHRFTIISRDSLHSLDAQEVRVFRSIEDEEGVVNSRIIVLMNVEKPDGKELEELKEKNESVPSPKRELEVDKLNLYPNPTSGRFTLSFELEDKGNTSIKIYNETGREVYSEQVKKLKGTYNKEIDLSGNPQGVYFVQVTQGKSGFTRKVLLQ